MRCRLSGKAFAVTPTSPTASKKWLRRLAAVLPGLLRRDAAATCFPVYCGETPQPRFVQRFNWPASSLSLRTSSGFSIELPAVKLETASNPIGRHKTHRGQRGDLWKETKQVEDQGI